MPIFERDLQGEIVTRQWFPIDAASFWSFESDVNLQNIVIGICVGWCVYYFEKLNCAENEMIIKYKWFILKTVLHMPLIFGFINKSDDISSIYCWSHELWFLSLKIFCSNFFSFSHKVSRNARKIFRYWPDPRIIYIPRYTFSITESVMYIWVWLDIILFNLIFPTTYLTLWRMIALINPHSNKGSNTVHLCLQIWF